MTPDQIMIAKVCVHQLFEQTADLKPELPAVMAGGEKLTVLANLISEQTDWRNSPQRHGVGQGCLVAICLDRTIELPVAMIAVLLPNCLRSA